MVKLKISIFVEYKGFLFIILVLPKKVNLNFKIIFMKKKNILALSLLISLIVANASNAMMWVEIEKGNNNGAQIMTITSNIWEDVKVQVKENWEKMMKDMEEKGMKLKENWEKMMKDMKDMKEKGMEVKEKVWKKLGEVMKKIEEKKEKIRKIAGEKAKKADEAMLKYIKKIENKNIEEKIAKYKKLNEKIDKVMAKYMSLDISEEKKESYKNLFEYIKTLNEEKITELEWLK